MLDVNIDQSCVWKKPQCNNVCHTLIGLPQLWMWGNGKMLIELLWVCVCGAALPLDLNGIEKVMILINHSAGPHQSHVADGMRINLEV